MRSVLGRYVPMAAAVAMGLGLVAAPGAASERQETYARDTLVCLKLFFDDPAAHARQCAGIVVPDLKSMGSSSDGDKPKEDCEVLGGPFSPGGIASDPCVKQYVELLLEQDGLRFYRFRYLGDAHVYYGVMARELLQDPRFAPAVHLAAAGYYTVDYDALGLVVPERDAMTAAGQRAMMLAAARFGA